MSTEKYYEISEEKRTNSSYAIRVNMKDKHFIYKNEK